MTDPVTKLEPCPFCGGDAYVDGVVTFFNLPKSMRYHAECSTCHARTAETATQMEAISRWNQRTKK